MDSSQYEFSPQESSIIGDLARRLGCVGMFMVVLGCLYGLAVITSALPFKAPGPDADFNISGLLVPLTFLISFGTGAFVLVFTGLAMRRGAERFQLIVTSEHNDIDHLMEALDELTKVYRVWAILMITAALLVVATSFYAVSAPQRIEMPGEPVLATPVSGGGQQP